MKKVFIIAGVILIAALIGWKLFSNKQIINENNQAIDRSGISIPVNVIAVQKQEISGVFQLPAVLKPMEEVDIAINASGKVKSLNIQLGTFVRKGQVIGSIDNSLKSINLETTQLQVTKLKQDYERIQELRAGNAATQVELDNAKYNLENAKMQITLLQQQIRDGSLVSPISGIVTAKNISVGEFINMGASAAKVVDVSQMKTSVMVSEKDVYRLSEGMEVKITSDVFADKPMTGKIRYISPLGDASHNYEVEVLVENKQKLSLKAGTFVAIEFDVKTTENVLQIPKNALAEGVKNPFVYVAQGNKPVIKKIVLGRDLGENFEVLSGLKEGDQVIVSGQINLTTNSIIEIIKNK
ncbi:MAG: efflux transporter periplasmic adaptor subunit [Bacteroidetes bacterium RIFCSPHIGHO2_02_FULL_44_7]|nr:MAG: efflux transporter periplasmic adaptor subunit [Bacteroidetes bacterium RIFCSPHIGHO2_02_FULL_44_7]